MQTCIRLGCQYRPNMFRKSRTFISSLEGSKVYCQIGWGKWPDLPLDPPLTLGAHRSHCTSMSICLAGVHQIVSTHFNILSGLNSEYHGVNFPMHLRHCGYGITAHHSSKI